MRVVSTPRHFFQKRRGEEDKRPSQAGALICFETSTIDAGLLVNKKQAKSVNSRFMIHGLRA